MEKTRFDLIPWQAVGDIADVRADLVRDLKCRLHRYANPK